MSIAYVTAVAARGGCHVSKPEIDKQSIDASVRPISGSKIGVDLQLKATSGDCIDGDSVFYDLPIKNYDDLRDEHCTFTHYLVILVLDRDESRWLETSQEALVIRRCAYWVDLRGRPAVPNKDTIRVRLPLSQMFDVAALQHMMQDAHASIRPRTGGAA